ncbi:MAG: hypothetical protein M3Q55_06525 [Acidobacteriota bacterium]|nr:hypothetical protein [Acidobacteriota bacterium]
MKKAVFVLLVVVGVGALPTNAFAGCADDLGACYYRVAGRSGFWQTFTGGIDCELDFIECARRKVLGR